jgi:nucleotide-binding universal stress UspA family protein
MNLFPSRILLAIDGSEEAELALSVAVELAKSTGAELHLVRVKLDEQVKKVEDAGGTVVGAHLIEEHPAEEIVTLAGELGAYPIVVGRRNQGRIRRALARSVSDGVVRHACCPVLVVGAGARVAGVAAGGFDRISAAMLST